MISAGTQLILSESSEADVYKCRVAEVEDGYLLIDYPISSATGRTAFLANGLRLTVSFRQQEDAVYKFETEILGREKRTIPVIRISYPGMENLEKVQRRQFVRVDAALDAALKTDSGSAQFVTMDLSAGGCALKLLAHHELSGGEEGEVILVLPFESGTLYHLRTSAKVLRVWERKGGKIASVQFQNIPDRDRQQIVRFCFEQQRLKRKRSISG